MDSDRTNQTPENNQQIQVLREELENAIAKLPPGFQQVPLSILVGQADADLREESGKGLLSREDFSGGRVGYLSSLRTLLSERKDPALTSEDYCFEQSAVAVIEQEMVDAGEPNLLDESDMPLFEQNPLSDPLRLVLCNCCSKPIRESHFSAHAERCLEQTARREEEERDAAVAVALRPPRKGRKKNGDGDNASGDAGAYPDDPNPTANRGASRGTKRALNPTEGGVAKAARARKSPTAGWQGGMEGGEGSAGVSTTPRGRTVGNAPGADTKKQKLPLSRIPLSQAELDVCCGVVSSHSGAPCRRAITCKYHLEPVKRAVLGRSEPYSALLHAYGAGGGSGARNVPDQGGGLQVTPREIHHRNPTLTFPAVYRGPLPLATKTTSHHYPLYMRGVIGALFQDARLRANNSAWPPACAAPPKPFLPPPKLTVAQLAKPAATPLSPPGAGNDLKKSRARSRKGSVPAEGLHTPYHSSPPPSEFPDTDTSLRRRFQQQQPGLMPSQTSSHLPPSLTPAQHPSHIPLPASAPGPPASTPGLPPLPYVQGGPKPKSMRKESVKQQKLAHRVQEEEAMLLQQQQQGMGQGLGGMGVMGGQEGGAGGKMLYGTHMGRQQQMMVETGGPIQMHHMTTMPDYPLLGSPGGQGLDHLGVGIQTMPDPSALRQPQADTYHHRMLGMGMGMAPHPHPALGLNSMAYPAGPSVMPSPMHHQGRQQPSQPSPTGAAMLAGATGDSGHLP